MGKSVIHKYKNAKFDLQTVLKLVNPVKPDLTQDNSKVNPTPTLVIQI